MFRSKRGAGAAGGMSMGALLGAFLILIVGLSLSPTVAQTVSDGAGNFTGVAQVLWNLIPLFWVIMILGIVAVVGIVQFKKMS